MVKIIGIAKKDEKPLLYYSFQKGGNNFFKAVDGKDGFTFEGKSYYVIVTDENNKEEKNNIWKYFQAVKQKEGYFLLYRPDGKSGNSVSVALSNDLIRFRKIGKTPPIHEAFTVVPEMKFRNRYVMYFGNESIKLAYSGDFKNWKPEEKVILMPRADMFDSGHLQAGAAFNTPSHILLIYFVKKEINNAPHYAVGAAKVSKKDPTEVLERFQEPVWEFPESLHAKDIRPLSCVLLNDQLVLYWLIGENNIYAVSCPMPFGHSGLKGKIFATLKRFKDNPILKPIASHAWESRATFNSAAVLEDGRVHFVYRALGDRDLSVLGYASSSDGLNIDERSDEPIYIPREPFETPGQKAYASFADHYMSGGGYGGVEDPRITKIDGKFYMTYVAFDGANPPRVALTSIGVDDFIHKKWEKWERPKLISAPGMVNKNAVIFPEKVKGKYVVFHRIFPNILVDFLDDLNFDEYLKGQFVLTPRKGHWDSKKIGAGAPPIKTKDGWLFIYQAVGYQDPGRYKIGAMLLDIDNPTKILYRSNRPIIAPDLHYENEGHKAGIVYPCGAVVKDNNLLVYYGGADTVTCAASQNLGQFLYDLKHSSSPKLHHVTSPVFN